MSLLDNIQGTLSLRHGFFGLGKFVSLDVNQQEDLLRLFDIVKAYVNNANAKRPINIYIEASPGSGKSFLVKQVFETVKDIVWDRKFRLLVFNLSTMQSKKDLVRCFRMVQDSNMRGNLQLFFLMRWIRR